ncbi:MAG: cache domain-containing protein [Sterolibacteriaceae bacterium]|nr:cache domain-containing protein [Sterolibacteriaceae bacterium]
MKKTIVAAALGVAFGANAYAAGEFATAKEAETFVQKAVKHLATAGKDKAFADFAGAEWRDRDLYVIVLDKDVNTMAHGANPKLVGKNMAGAQDVDGVKFAQTMADSARAAGKSWTDYKFTDPVSKKVLPKAAYCEKQSEFVVCSGIYKR